MERCYGLFLGLSLGDHRHLRLRGYLILLFSIITDLFRDHKTSGWVKAIWIVFLFFVPLLTALVYLITRSKSMAERSMAAAQEAKQAQDSYIRSVAGKSSAEQIADAKASSTRARSRRRNTTR